MQNNLESEFDTSEVCEGFMWHKNMNLPLKQEALLLPNDHDVLKIIILTYYSFHSLCP